MNNKKTLIALAIVSSLSIITSLVLLQRLPHKMTQEIVETQAVGASSTQVEFKTLSLSKPQIDIEIDYPQFSGHAELNEKIKKEAEDLFASTTEELQDSLKEEISYNPSGETSLTMYFNKKVIPEKTYINNDTMIASVSYNTETFAGGAHGSFWYESAAYDLKNGLTLALGDLLLGNSEIDISGYINTQIEETSTTSATCVNCEWLEGFVWNKNDLTSNSFALSKDGITFLYGAYGLGGYVTTAGGQEIFVPKTFMKEMIKRDW